MVWVYVYVYVCVAGLPSSYLPPSDSHACGALHRPPRARPEILEYELQGRDITRSIRMVEVMLGTKGSASTRAAMTLQKRFRQRLKKRGAWR